MVCRLKSGRRKNILQKRTENRNIRYLCKTEQQNRTKAYAGESEEDNVPHTRGILSYRTNRNGLLQIRRVIDWWLPYQGLKNEVDYYISTINKELSTDNGYKRKNCLAKSGKDNNSAIAEISSELVEISSDLVEISSELVWISSELVSRISELLIISTFRKTPK